MCMHADGLLRTVRRHGWRLVLLLAFGLLGARVHAADVVVLQVQDAIGPASADYIVRGMAKAHQAGAKLVVLELDTPGGLDTSMRQIIRAILAMCEGLGMDVVAEGIEEEAQAERLIEFGCAGGQGYLFGRPANANATLGYLRDNFRGAQHARAI